MRPASHGVNAIMIGDTELLLTTTGGGSAVHLAAVADAAGSRQSAVPDFYFEPEWASRRPTLANYDRGALLAARWSPRTLCGREWAIMVGGDGGSLSLYGEDPAFAPTCRRCLALMDRLFAPPPPHPQLPLVARMVADTVVEHGYAEIHGVPGDQLTELRRRVRELVRASTGHRSQTLVRGSILIVVCEPLHDQHAEAHHAAFADALDDFFSGRPSLPRPAPAWRLSWSTWANA